MFSLRWKLVSTYLLLIVMVLVLVSTFFVRTYKDNAINDRKTNSMAEANIIAAQLRPNIMGISREYTRNYINRIIRQKSIDIDSRIIVTNKMGEVLIDSYDSMVEENLLDQIEVSRAVEGYSSYGEYYIDNYGRVMYVAVPIRYNGDIIGSIFISNSLNSIYEDIQNIKGKIFGLAMTSLFVTTVISFIFADILSKPLLKLNSDIEDYTLGNNDVNIEVTGNDEISYLGYSINDMIRKLSQVDKRRRKFVSNVSHELKTPVTSVKILAETLMHSNEYNKELYDDFLGDINSELDRLSNIIDDLLYLVEIEKDDLEMNYKMTYINYLIENTIGMLSRIAEKKNIDIKFNPKDNVQIMVDQDKLKQCMINIINNAVKYTPDGGHIEVDIEMGKDFLEISVSDTGFGIPKKNLEFIFDRFYRVDKARSRETGGTGLGLSIVKQIVDLHNGKIHIDSEVDVGTKFSIFLPIRNTL